MRTQHTNHGAFLGATQQTLFQLPPPPPGMQWHREDGWKEGDLPQGIRPLVAGEESGNGTQQKYDTGWVKLHNSVIADAEENLMRTTRPLTFTHAGKTWTWHRPGSKMPCKEGERIYWLYKDGVFGSSENPEVVGWERNEDKVTDIIGWRYADEKKTVPLGPEDVPPGSVFRAEKSEAWFSPTRVTVDGIHHANIGQGIQFTYFTSLHQARYEINRSIPLTGKWNPDAWEPCSKEVLA